MSPFTAPTVAAHISWGFFLSTASNFIPTSKKFFGGAAGSVRNMCAGATSALCNVFKRNIGQEDAFIRNPNGGCSIPPRSSQLPTGWISLFVSTKRQKSFLLSDPSRRSRNLGPRVPTIVAIQVEVRFLGSKASSFIPILNSFFGGTLCCLKHLAGAGTALVSLR